MGKRKLTDVFKAIADPTRRQILQILVVSKALTMLNIYSQFDSSRQAVTRHLQVLSRAGLVDIVLNGRERTCYLRAARLSEVYEWVKHYEKFWDEKFLSLDNYLKNNKT